MAKEPIEQQSLNDFLNSQFHCYVSCTATSEAAIALADRQRFDLILINLSGPEMDGLAAVQRIRQGVNQRTPIVATSGWPDAANRLAEAGVNVWLAKPFAPLKLSATIQQLIGRTAQWTFPKRANEIDALVARRLKERRLELGLARKVLGDLIKVTTQQIQKYELAQNRISSGHLFYFAQALQVPINYFFFDTSLERKAELWLNGQKIVTKQGGEVHLKISGIQLNHRGKAKAPTTSNDQ